MANILILHGPNLNLLGTREPEHYGALTLSQIDNMLTQLGQDSGHQVSTKQHNAEDKLIYEIHEASSSQIDFIIINPAAYTHSSIAIRDALLATKIPFIEVHLSNPNGRESFRQHSYLSDIARGVISGFGHLSYVYALEYIMNIYREND